MSTPRRSRTFEWEDPRLLLAAAQGSSGLESLQRFVKKELLDSAMGCAVHSMMPAGVGYTTLEIKVNFVRALTAGTGTVRGEGTVVYMGKRTATAEGRIVDLAGKLYAHATTTCIVLAQ